MKRKIAIATLTAAALVGTGTLSAAAFADDGGEQRSATSVVQDRDDDRGQDRDDRDDDRGQDRDDDRDDKGESRGEDKDDRAEAKSAGTTASEAAAAAEKAAPGTVTSVDLDQDRKGLVWEVELIDGKTSHEVQLDAKTNKVVGDKKESADENVPANLKVSAKDAADKAAAHGTVTSVDLDDDRNGAWEVETTGKNGQERDFSVDPASGKLTKPASENEDHDSDASDDRDDQDDRDDDGRDDDAHENDD
ncbi:PepSY domain-containing protein [Streptomyces albidus (ex Kaewkla and Franco 2022)]|uniref:PepSY domain-containing protein n=1 Tax=Streptomyces albidus (ex Kaewkla and Franco 2022) TaxID=722709 RepID=UPI0015EE6E21|nr:PepSY domain-containing protein [Streptomyces albidus (ex Kaewkla and Franco 2022)]